ncbi:hypothetical protein [Palleronia caenipelagi]|uniref:Uncharacterized protein n=1 Tax=Palleronia caenipelagi TaxID=2489174 RepID=A0A547QAQ7_9RHOB|nr:hypothetical protein [Palleronia caenipelagi]TRD23473.1 hypothetical protein FEV53_00200 [Palleronia caenipelagi]
MSRDRRPAFLDRAHYRRRRVMDAARVLPFAGLFLFFLPGLYGSDNPHSTASTGLFLFGSWAGLIVAAAFLSRRLARIAEDEGSGRKT